MGFYELMANSTVIPPYTAVYSPITFNQEWSKVGRLLIMLAASIFGATMNGFFISSFFVERSLKENVYQGGIGLADSVVTCGIVPMVTIVLLSGEWDLLMTCKVLQFMTEYSTMCYSLFFLFIAVENYIWVRRRGKRSASLLLRCSKRLSLVVMIISALVGGVGVFLQLDLDYCSRQYFGNPTYRIITYVLFHGMPCVLTVVSLTTASLHVSSSSRHDHHYRRSKQFVEHRATTNLNITAYAFYVAFWVPFLVVSLLFPSASDGKFYMTAWLGVSRALITSAFFGLASETFRRAYAHLFNYCCCKATVSGSWAGRTRHVFEQGGRDVHMHLLQRAVDPGLQRAVEPGLQRAAAAAAAIRDPYEL